MITITEPVNSFTKPSSLLSSCNKNEREKTPMIEQRRFMVYVACYMRQHLAQALLVRKEGRHFEPYGALALGRRGADSRGAG